MEYCKKCDVELIDEDQIRCHCCGESVVVREETRVEKTARETLETKNWTGLSLRELIHAGRVSRESVRPWITAFFIDRGKIACGAFFEKVVSNVETRVETIYTKG